MRQQERRNLVKTGIFMSALIGVFMIFAIFIGKENQWFSPKEYVKAVVPTANNLRPGGVVHFQGIKVGKVESVSIEGQDKVAIGLEIDGKYLKWIKKDSTVDITSQGLVGDKLLKIKSGAEDSPAFDPSKDVLGPHASMQMPDIAQTGGEIAVQVDRVLAKFEILLNQMNKDAHVASTVANLNQAAGKLNALLADMEKRGFSRKMSSAMGELDKAMGRINSGPGTMHSLVYEDELYNRLNMIVGGAGRSDVLKYFIRKSLDEEKENKGETP